MRAALLLMALFGVAGPGYAAQIPFDTAWKEQGFPLLPSNDYDLNGRSVGVVSDGTVSILYRRLPASLQSASTASWRWSVETGVPSTDLNEKGGDDRNLAVYFVFADRATAQQLEGRPLRSLLSADGVRVLIYVWGGRRDRGTILPSPYIEGRGFTLIRRPASTGTHAESVDLSADLQAAFGERPEVLLGVAISADSDDTDSRIEGTISGLTLE